jgi:branched-chain amino acid transport system ATP-binding protein
MTLTAERVEMHFGGVRALDGVDLTVNRGEVVGLIGPNGSGKTTMLNVLTHYLRPSAGRVTLDGRDITSGTVQEMAGHGVGRTYQTPRLFSSMTVLQNVAVAVEFLRRKPSFWRGLSGLDRLRSGTVIKEAEELLRVVGAADLSDRVAGDLPPAQARRAEIARALASAQTIFMLDEPGAGMTQQETNELSKLLKLVAAERNVGVLVVEHNVPFVRSACERLYVLNEGRLLAEGPTEEVLNRPEVVRAYLGQTD